MLSSLEVRRARPDELEAARACYLRNDYQGGLAAEDVPVVALDQGRVVGVVRLVSKPDIQLLRGMFIDEAYRGRGLGRRMLRALEPLIPQGPCFLTCPGRLVHFYGEIGFELIPDEQSPQFLQERVAGYRERHGDQRILLRSQ